ncbi:MAG: type II toxin-antitoxin system RatA family toxin [Alphaproteobacteria bacterium]|nr:MAG: type II toxin-antitoxin system RatA family toxin [Alphaproteobacteria bacterium]
MPHHAERRHLPYAPEQVFDLVADVGRYPEFLPWLITARVYARRADGFDADLVVGFRMFRERFTSRVHLDRPRRIFVEYVKGPLSHLHNEWRFEPAEDGGTIVDFTVDFAFRSTLFERLVGALFTEAVHRMVSAFEKRAQEIYGMPGEGEGDIESGAVES